MKSDPGLFNRLQPSKSHLIRSDDIVPEDITPIISQETLALWTGSSQPGDTGYEAVRGNVVFSVFEIPAVPDFSSPTFYDLAQLDPLKRLEHVCAIQDRFLAGLYSLGPFCAISLRYWFDKPLYGEGRIRLFLIGRSFGFTEKEALFGIFRFRELVKQNFPREYRLIDLTIKDRDLLQEVVSLDGIRSVVEILKSEEQLSTWHDPELCGFSSYYYPLPFAASKNSMVNFCHALTRSEKPVVVDLCLIPGEPLTETELRDLSSRFDLSSQWAKGRNESIKGLYSEQRIELAPDPHAERAKEHYQKLAQKYGNSQNPAFLYGFRLLGWEPCPPESLAAALTSSALEPGGGWQICLIPEGHPAIQKAVNSTRLLYITASVCNEKIWRHPEAPETIRRLHRLADLKEVAGFFRLPIPGREGCPGIPLDAGILQPEGITMERAVQSISSRKTHPVPRQVSSQAKIKLGRFLVGNRVSEEDALFSVNDLNKHCLIVGTPGSGKTTLCFSLLQQLWENYRIPFIVLEPAKTEYRALKGLDCFSNDLLIFTVGNERASPFRFNPFEILDRESISEHISGLNICLSGAFSLWDPLPAILDESIRRIYADSGWSEYGIGGEDPGLWPPTLEDLYHQALAVSKSKSYRGESAGNVQGALETRLGSLLRGPKGRCFNTRRSIPAEILLSKPVVLELESLNDDEKAMMMMFVLALVRSSAKVQRKSGSPLSHLVLVEEAHNVIGRGDDRGKGNHQGNPKRVAINFFTNMLAEMRALGEGIIVADQLPKAIAPEALKNTNIKIMHRLVAADDREELGKNMVFDSGQFHTAAILPPGQSLVFLEGWPRSRPVLEPNFKEDLQIEVPPDDDQVREWMAFLQRDEGLKDIFLPFSECRSFCQVCDQRVREESERWIERKRPAIDKAVREWKGITTPLGSALEIFSNEPVGSVEKPLSLICAFLIFQEKLKKAVILRDI